MYPRHATCMGAAHVAGRVSLLACSYFRIVNSLSCYKKSTGSCSDRRFLDMLRFTCFRFADRRRVRLRQMGDQASRFKLLRSRNISLGSTAITSGPAEPFPHKWSSKSGIYLVAHKPPERAGSYCLYSITM